MRRKVSTLPGQSPAKATSIQGTPSGAKHVLASNDNFQYIFRCQSLTPQPENSGTTREISLPRLRSGTGQRIITFLLCRIGILDNKLEKDRCIPRTSHESHERLILKFLDQRRSRGVPSPQMLLQNGFIGFLRLCHQFPNGAARCCFSPMIEQELLP
jgi:hypothetical protein